MATVIGKQDILNYFLFIWLEADGYWSGHARADWDENRLLYTDAYMFRNKLDWQSQIHDPVVDNLVTRMTNFFSRIIVTSDDEYYDVFQKEQQIADGFKQTITAVFNDNKFPLAFSDAFKFALLTSPYITKIDYIYDLENYPTFDAKTGRYGTVDSVVGRTKIIPINPYDIRLDPFGDQYIIEVKQVDLVMFKLMARANKWESIEEVTVDAINPSANKDTPPSQYRPTVTLYYIYTKAVSDKFGNILDTNVHFIVANKKYIVYYKKNLLPKSQFPYVVGFPMKSVASRYGRGYISKIRSVVIAYLDALNLVLDSFVLATMGLFEYNTTTISTETAHMFTAMLKPGKFYPVTAPQTVRQIYTQDIPPLALNVLMSIDRILQNRSFQTEFFMGAPTVKGRPTASEIAIKTQETTGFFTDIAAEIERSIIIPTLDLVIATELIHMNDPYHVDYSKNYTSTEAYKQITTMTFNERMDHLKNTTFESKGISGKIIKIGSFQKIMQLLNVLGNMPQLLAALDAKKFITKLFSTLDEAPDELLNMEALDSLSMAAGQPQGAPTAPAGQPGQPNPANLGNIMQGIQQGMGG